MIKYLTINLFTILERSATASWRRVFESPRMFKGWLLKASLVVTSSLSLEIAISAYLFSRSVFRLWKKSGY